MLDQITIDMLNSVKDLIKDRNYELAYMKIHDSKNLSSMHLFTEALLHSGINPLLYLTRVPSSYMSKGNDENLIINVPNNVTSIGLSSFFKCKVKKIILPDTIDYIDGVTGDAFWFIDATILCSEAVKNSICDKVEADKLLNVRWEIV